VNVFDDGVEAGAGDAFPGVRDGVEEDEEGPVTFACCDWGFAEDGRAADGA
jgi:hypothetical protein